MKAFLGAGSVAVGCGGMLSAIAHAGAPWWALVLIVIIAMLLTAVFLLGRLVMPQNSQDRLNWWRDMRRNRVGRKTQQPRLPHGSLVIVLPARPMPKPPADDREG